MNEAPAPVPSGAAGSPVAGRLARLLVLLLIVGAGWRLWVPRERVVLMNDMLGYAAQGRALLAGDGNGVRLDATRIPGYYPAGMPLLVAGAFAVLGPDLRNGQIVVWIALLVLLALLASLARRVAGPWAAPLALLVLLASPAFRDAASLTLSQVPTAALMLGSALLFLRDDGASLFAAGLLSAATLLLRYANVSFPLAIGLSGLLVARGRRAPWRSLFALAAGVLAGAGCVLLHNAWAYGGPFATGYAAWGHHVEGQFALHNLWSPVMIGNRGDESLALRSFFGLGELYQLPVLPAAAWGAVVLLRTGGAPRRLAVLALVAVAAQDLFLACYAFRSESYLVPALPLLVVLAAAGVLDVAGRLLHARGPALALVGGGLLLAYGLRTVNDEAAASMQEAIDRHDALARAGQELPPDAALLTPSDFALVEPLVRTAGRRILYVGPFVSDVVEQAAMAELGGGPWRPYRVVPWVNDRLKEGRPVYLDQNPPPRGLATQHREVRASLLEHFALHATDIKGLFRIERKT